MSMKQNLSASKQYCTLLSAQIDNQIDNVALAAFSAQITTDDKFIQLLPAGYFRSNDGRPKDLEHWYIDSNIARKLIDDINQRGKRFIVDYEHNTLLTKETGNPAPLAGTCYEFEWREGLGLFAKVKWTDRAKQMIANGEYLYISPVFYFNKLGHVTELRMAAITNDPGLSGMDEIALAANVSKTQKEEPKVNEMLLALLSALGLPESASQDEALAAINSLQERANAAADLEAQVATLSARNNVDPSKYVSLEAFDQLKEQLVVLRTEKFNDDLEQVVEAALSSGHLLPAQKDWAMDYGKKDLDGLKGYLKETPALVSLTSRQTEQVELDDKTQVALSAEEIEVCNAMGVRPEDYAKSLQS